MTMELEELVQQIARKVLTELGEQRPQPSTLIFTQRDKGIAPDIEKCVSRDVRLLYSDDQYSIETIDRFILPCLYIDQMVDLAMGKGGSRLMYSVREVLLAGKKVEVAKFEYKQFLDTAPASLLAVYHNYHDILQQFGVIDLITQQSSPPRCIKGGVITEEHIMKAHREGIPCLEVSESCCVTPLAYDCAKEHSIVIKRVTGVEV